MINWHFSSRGFKKCYLHIQQQNVYLSILVDIPTVAVLPRLPKKYSEKQTEKIESNLSNSELNYCVKGEKWLPTNKQVIDEAKPNKRYFEVRSVFHFYFWGNGKHGLHYYSSLFVPRSIYYYYHLQLSDAIFILCVFVKQVTWNRL